MVNAQRRKKLAFHLRQLVAGQITNDDFENNVMDDVSFGWLPEQYYRSKQAKNDDAAIRVILENSYCLYSDLKNYKLRGRHELSSDDRKHIARWILFLHSDLEYEYPYFSVLSPMMRFSLLETIVTILTFGYYLRKQRSRQLADYEIFIKSGDYEYWPFVKQEDYVLQLQTPPFLASGAS